MNKRKKILILGVTGQDGSFMARYLIEKKYQVHGLVRKSATGNLKNIQNFCQMINYSKDSIAKREQQIEIKLQTIKNET